MVRCNGNTWRLLKDVFSCVLEKEKDSAVAAFNIETRAFGWGCLKVEAFI